MELVELTPLVDPTYATPSFANRCVRVSLTGIAMREEGNTDVPLPPIPTPSTTAKAERRR